jgi:hypothetical protein
MKFKNKILLVGFISIFSIAILLSLQTYPRDAINFSCRGRLHTDIINGECRSKSAADIFLSFNPQGEGFILVTGSRSCENSQRVKIDVLANFSYKREGDFYTMRVQNAGPDIEALFSPLKYKDIKMKITALNSGDYRLSLPNETLMVCTED